MTNEDCLIYPNKRYARDVIRALGLEQAKGAPCPIVKLRREDGGEEMV